MAFGDEDAVSRSRELRNFGVAAVGSHRAGVVVDGDGNVFAGAGVGNEKKKRRGVLGLVTAARHGAPRTSARHRRSAYSQSGAGRMTRRAAV